MSEEKLYAVKTDEGEFLSFSDDGDSVWNKAVGHFEKDKQKARSWAYNRGGHVVTLIEEPKKVVLTKEQAEIVEGTRDATYPASYISNYTNSHDCEENLLINAYVNGYTVAKEKKYNVKVPHTKDVWYYKASEAYLQTICPADKKLRGKFTEADIDNFGLQDCEKEEVTDDDD
ncbi:DUF1642 domain-containing protein [Lacticaseibacillus paracasei]|uniref:DUF1642 domain-containing protein n=1 Tax=Lacticaseibacillus paracasei TaxID=1597 RepID=UPI001C1E4B27|nr:DUF1642 domain-containing protein [Lacticaseibacillus paracasei]MBU6048335.1 DUF1642 domain-containing protein [Lacticaseibacillus paracasei]MCL4973154.1 DUF1642 domain-containing protein [Lacticaseibacillus paracasei]